jgi:hypothetical protein
MTSRPLLKDPNAFVDQELISDVIRPVLARLAEAEEPLDWHDYPRCVLCGINAETSSSASPKGQFEAHEPTCPWRQARELLGLAP